MRFGRPREQAVLAVLFSLVVAGCATESPAPTSSLLGSVVPGATTTPSQKATPVETPIPTGWTRVGIDGFDVRGIAEGAGRLVAVGNARAAFTSLIATSGDGAVWTTLAIPDVGHGLRSGVEQVAYGAGGFVATGGRYNDVTGIAEPFILHSADGLTWEEVTFPGPCAFGSSILTGVWGYVIVAGSCHGEGEIDPRPIRVLASPDGTHWTSTTDFAEFSDVHRWPGPVATDGKRIVALQGEHRGDAELRWISDDRGMTWKTFPQTPVSLYEITFARDRWFARGSENGDSVLCTSSDGENWTCQVADVPVPPVVATSTGFVSVSYRSREGLHAGVDSVETTSIDGVEWHESIVGPPNLLYYGIAATSHGVFAWGGTEPDQDPTGLSTPFLIVHRTPIP